MNHNNWPQELSKGRFHEQFFPVETLFLSACLGREGGVQVDRVQKEFKPLFSVQSKKIRVPKKFSSIQDNFFKHGVWNKFGKF